jgi:Helix-loop-helix DNA-binding domain
MDEKYEMDENCLIIFGNCHEINSIDMTDNYDSFGNEMEMTTKQRSQANARERFRTHRFIEKISDLTDFTTKNSNSQELMTNFSHRSVNSAFNTLRLLIPTEPKNRKLSKIETLRLAKSYISHLNATLTIGKCWIFHFQHQKWFMAPYTSYCYFLSFSLLQLFFSFLFLKETLHVGSRALKHQRYRSNNSRNSSIKMIIAQISAHSVFPQSFIKRGLIKDYLWEFRDGIWLRAIFMVYKCRGIK